MAWQTRFDPRAERDLRRLDPAARRKIIHYLESRVAVAADPESLGKQLSGPLAGLWRYRVENYRIICRIQQEQLLVLVLAAGHRKDIYRDQ